MRRLSCRFSRSSASSRSTRARRALALSRRRTFLASRRARGGRLRPDGFYELDVVAPERPLHEVPQNRRGQRRRRQAMFDSIGDRLNVVLADPDRIRIGQHEPFP